MNPHHSARRSVSLAPGIAIFFVGALSTLVLFGWWADVEGLKRITAKSVAMNPATAVSFLLTGAALWVMTRRLRGSDDGNGLLWIARFLLAAVAVVSASRLLGTAVGYDSPFDRFLFASKLDAVPSEPANRMAPNTAFNFLLACSAIAFLDAGRRSWLAFSQGAVLLMLLTSFISFVGYTVGAQALYQPLPFIGMAIHTGVGFGILGLGVLAADNSRGVTAIVTSPFVGGSTARKILPVAVLAPLVVGWFVHWGQRARLYGDELGIGLMILTCTLLLGPVTLRAAWQLNRADEERRKNEEEASKAAQHLAHALDISGSAIVSVDAAQKIVYCDERAERMFGLERNEALGRPLDLLIPERFGEAHRGYVRDFSNSDEKARRMGERSEVYGRRKDGTEFPAEAAISKSWLGDKPMMTAVVRDITERKRIEEEVLQRERLAAANAELESFSYSVSHDLRAPLRHIDGFIQLLRKRALDSLDEKSRRYLTTIADSATRMGVLIDDLLSFSRMSRTELTKRSVDLAELLNEVLRELKPETEGRSIEWKIDPLPVVECDGAMVEQVFANLVGNALKFTRERESARIEIGEGPKQNGQAVFYVRDNGAGFDMRYVSKLFGVFQRLHREEEFEGTGIGLANVRRIVRRHGGEAWAEGEVGKGAAFYFSLPKEEGETI